jgi:hypothetical protein
MEKHLDKSLTKEQRKIAYKKLMESKLNPIKDFDPEDFEPLASDEEKDFLYRKRIKPGKKLPTFGLKPKEIMEGQLIGMFESKQDLYLLIAHINNDMQDKMDAMQKQIDDLTKQLKGRS